VLWKETAFPRWSATNSRENKIIGFFLASSVPALYLGPSPALIALPLGSRFQPSQNNSTGNRDVNIIKNILISDTPFPRELRLI